MTASRFTANRYWPPTALADAPGGTRFPTDPRAPAADQADELRTLEARLAYVFAREVIESELVPLPRLCARDGVSHWFRDESEGEVDVFDAIRYLELRGLLERHPDEPDVFRILDVPEVS